MSDTIDDFRALRDHRREQRARYGVPCPECAIARPRAPASLLMPGQRCKVDGFRDPRPRDEAQK